MKLIIEENAQQEETEIKIKCAYIDEGLSKLISQIRNFAYMMKGEKDGKIFSLVMEDIIYIESINEQTYLIMKDDRYRSDKKLYELEDSLKMMHFVRISKSCIVNVNQLQHVTPLFDGKFEALASNGDILIINRHYLKMFKEAFGL